MIKNNINNKWLWIAWCLYDWASSAFPVIVTTFIFATYFTSQIAKTPIIGTYQWANATAVASLLVACLSPLFGAIADYSGRLKWWLLFFSLLCMIPTALLWFALPNINSVTYTLTCVVLGTVGLEVALVFYNSFLPRITSENYIGRLSGLGWGCGYIGGIVILSIALFVFVKSPPHWLNASIAEQVRICGPLVAIWFALFSLPLFMVLPDVKSTGLSLSQAVQRGVRELFYTFKTMMQQKNLIIFLIAHLVYIDGLNTLFAFGGIYAADTFHLPLSEVIIFGLTMNISAGIGAIALGWLDDYAGSKKTILLSLICLMLFGVGLLLVKTTLLFWIFGLLLSVFLGPVQSASRSLMARLTPIEKSTEYFGLYSFSGRVTSFMGPWILGEVTLHFSSQRVGMSTVLLFFIVGAGLMCFVREP